MLTPEEIERLAQIKRFEQTDNADTSCKVLQVHLDRSYLLEIIDRLSASPEGWKLVPREPTPEMLAAEYAKTYQPGHSAAIYKAMYDAAPPVKGNRE